MWVRILALKLSLQMATQSRRDCSEAAGDVSSMYSTPNASRALAIAILVLVSKKALANCSPSVETRPQHNEFYETLVMNGDGPLRVLSMMLKFDTLLRKSEARQAYGFLRCWSLCIRECPFCIPFVPRLPFTKGTATISGVDSSECEDTPFS